MRPSNLVTLIPIYESQYARVCEEEGRLQGQGVAATLTNASGRSNKSKRDSLASAWPISLRRPFLPHYTHVIFGWWGEKEPSTRGYGRPSPTGRSPLTPQSIDFERLISRNQSV